MQVRDVFEVAGYVCAMRMSLIQLEVRAQKWLVGQTSHFWEWQHLIHWASPASVCVFSLPPPQNCWTLFFFSQGPRVEVVCWWICPRRLSFREPLTAITVKLSHETGIKFSASLCRHQLSVESNGFVFATCTQPSYLVSFPICTEMVPVLSQGICETQNWPPFTLTWGPIDDVIGFNWL